MEENNPQGRGLRWNIAQRLEFIEFRLVWEGRVNRSDIADRFGVTLQQASADLALYESTAPTNIAYDRNAKTFLAARSFVPHFLREVSDRQLLQLSSIAAGLVEREDTWFGELPPVGVLPVPQRSVSTKVVRSILEAIRNRAAVEIEYQSLKRPDAIRRMVEPHALAHNGIRWHIRAWCPKNTAFRDFVLSRITGTGEFAPRTVDPLFDREWFDEIELLLAPNPALSDGARRSLVKEYGMTRGRLRLVTRVALAFYLIQHLNLDLDLPPERQQLVLLNKEAVDKACKDALAACSSALAGRDAQSRSDE